VRRRWKHQRATIISGVGEMSATSSNGSVFCHSCGQVVQKSQTGETCARCGGEFIEVLEEAPSQQRHTSTTTQSTSSAPPPFPFQLPLFGGAGSSQAGARPAQPPTGPAVPFMQGMPFLQHGQGAGRSPASGLMDMMVNVVQALAGEDDEWESDGEGWVTDDGEGEEEGGDNQGEEGERERQSVGEEHEGQVGEERVPQPDARPQRRERRVRRREQNRGGDGQAGLPNDPLSGLLAQLFESYEPRTNPPASKQVVEQLVRTKVTEDNRPLFPNHDCAVCQDDFVDGVEIMQMHCGHVFHTECLMPWLEKSNSCPICREELPTDDYDYEVSSRHHSR